MLYQHRLAQTTLDGMEDEGGDVWSKPRTKGREEKGKDINGRNERESIGLGRQIKQRERVRGGENVPGTLFLWQMSQMYCKVSTGILPSIHTMGADTSVDSNFRTCITCIKTHT